MTSHDFWSILTFILCFFVSVTLSHFEQSENPKLLLISFDAFRWNYLDRLGRTRAPNFFKLIDSGVRPDYVKNAFITKTFPNHWTIATGLFEESHGVIDNRMYDPKFNETFAHTAEQMADPKWWDAGIGVLPIWMANQLAGNDRRSGCAYFPGSLVSFQDELPYQSLGPYNATMPKSDIINSVMDWFLDPHHPINFGAIYIDQPDRISHDIGPDDPKLDAKIEELDKIVIGRIFERLNASEDLEHDLNIIVTGDHGMTQVSKDRLVLTDETVDPSLYTLLVDTPPIWHIQAKQGHEEEVLTKFRSIPHLTTWKREEVPAQFHYSHHRRIGPIVVMAELGWLMVQNQKAAEAKGWATKAVFGQHGYNNSAPDMHPFFIGYGPAFRSGVRRGPLDIVDIYPLMCRILGVQGGLNNGSIDHVLDMLVPPKHHDMTTTFVTFLVVVVCASLVTGIYTLAFLCHRRRARPVVRKIRLLESTNGLDLSHKPMLHGLSDDELDL